MKIASLGFPIASPEQVFSPQQLIFTFMTFGQDLVNCVTLSDFWAFFLQESVLQFREAFMQQDRIYVRLSHDPES